MYNRWDRNGEFIKAFAHNNIIRIEDADINFESDLREKLSYVDKSKQYQIRKMQKNPFSRASPLYSQLVGESEGSLLESDGAALLVPPGFFNLIKRLVPQFQDLRSETGKSISLPWANSSYSFSLRDYQEEAVQKALVNYRGIINFATGLGKTKTAISLIRSLKRKTLVVCPSKSIAFQFKKELEDAFGISKVGFIGDGKYKPNLITVGIAQSVVNKIDLIKELDLGVVIVDEAHHIAASTFYSIATGLANTGRIYGLSATAFRSDGKDIYLQAGCGDILIERDVKWGVANGWLADPYFIIRKVNTTGKDFKDDKLRSYKEHVLKSNIMNDRLISDANAFIGDGKQTLILVDQIEHGEFLAHKLGIPFANGKDKNSEELIGELNDRKILGLVATDGVIGEGVDTREIDVLILANFIASKGGVLQAVGRALRKTQNKNKAIILDYSPQGSTMMKRHADQRISYYREITHNVKIV